MAEYVGRSKKPLTPKEAMAIAICEGLKGAGYVSPNPLVGCVILDREGRLISTGYHKKYGGPHAEIEALKGLSDDLIEGASVYVTLEPCAHHGKTPPCAEKLAKLPIGKVVYGIIDPNPLVSGKGVEILRQAGIAVEGFNDLKDDLEELPEVFLHNVRHKKPFVALKVATSMDGQMGLQSGDSKWITNEKSREYAHYLRGIYDAILIGRRTLLIDDPSLNVRHKDFAGKKNKVVMLDPEGECAARLKSSKLFKCHDPQDIFYVVGTGLAESLKATTDLEGIQVVEVPLDATKGLDIDRMLDLLYQGGVHSLLVEGGAYVYQSFLTQKKVQRVYQFQAPILLGAKTGLSWTKGFGVATMSEKITLDRIHIRLFDTDILVTGRLS